MIINMVGNTNGSYNIPQIDLFESAKQKENAPEKITTVSDILGDKAGVKIDISEEGLKALHGTKLNGSADPFETAKQIAYMADHQPVESFTNQFSQMMPKNYTISESGEAVFTPHTMEEKESALIDGFKKLFDEVSKGYDEGTRVRYIEDPSSEDGYRKLSKDEELAILKMEFDDYVDSRFGDERKAQDEAVKESLEEVRDIMQKLGRNVSGKEPESEQIPENFAEKLKGTTTDYAESHGFNISLMKNFIAGLKNIFSPMDMLFPKLI